MPVSPATPVVLSNVRIHVSGDCSPEQLSAITAAIVSALRKPIVFPHTVPIDNFAVGVVRDIHNKPIVRCVVTTMRVPATF